MGAGGCCVLELPQRIPRHDKVMLSGHEKTLVPSIETGPSLFFMTPKVRGLVSSVVMGNETFCSFPLGSAWFCDVFRWGIDRKILRIQLLPQIATRLLIVVECCLSMGELAAHELAVALLLVRVWYAGYTQG